MLKEWLYIAGLLMTIFFYLNTSQHNAVYRRILSQGPLVTKAAQFMLRTRLLGQFRNLPPATGKCAQEDERLEVGTTAPSQDGRIQREIQNRSLFDIWMEFVYSERIQEGMYNNLVETNKRGCECGKGRMTFPHWPPTSLDEAKALFNNCLDKENTHRKYLARS
jgi:hypothetical protein